MTDTSLIKEKIDILQFIGDYVQLKPAGSNHKGLCPFHNEKSPSFMVSPERQSWHCFGCNKGGDVFSFLQEIEGISFVDALKQLAERAGVELTGKMQNKAKQDEKARLKEINLLAARFYHHVLTKLPASKAALAYLKQRGLSDVTIEKWQIGFIPDQWDLFTKYALKKGQSIDDLVASGLTIKRDNARPGSNRGFYDRFRGRIMFPLRDIYGNVLGFSGRILVETEKSGGKYINTPQTILFDKSRMLFGLHHGKQAIKKADQIIMVEGQMDVITVHQAGFEQVIATSGTALTEYHIEILRRYSKNLAIAFDSDAAGNKAAKRGIDLAIEAGMNVRIIRIPEGQGDDPADCINKNADVWAQSVTDAQDVMQWYLEQSQRGKDVNQPKDKQAIADTVLKEIARIPFAVEQDHWLRQLANTIHVEHSVLREDLQRFKTDKEVPTRNIRSTEIKKEEEIARREDVLSEEAKRLRALYKELYLLLLRYPTFLNAFKEEQEKAYYSDAFVHVINRLRASCNEKGEYQFDREGISPEQQAKLHGAQLEADILYKDLSPGQAKGTYEQLIQFIAQTWIKQRREALQKAIRIAEQKGDQNQVMRLLKEVTELGRG